MINNSYKANFKYPDPNIEPSKKDSKYRLLYGKALYANFDKNGVKSYYNDRTNIATLIKYAIGNQDVNQYKQLLNCWEGNGGNLININWQVLDLANKHLNIVTEKLMKFEFDIIASPIDSVGTGDMDQKKAKMKAYIQMKKSGELEQMGATLTKAQLGFDPDSLPDDEDELEIMFELTEKHEAAMRAELEISKALNANRWEPIKKNIVKNLVYLGVGAVEVRNDNYGNTSLYNINPEQLIAPSSAYEDMRSIPHIGYVESVSFTQFKMESAEKFTEEEYQKIYEKIADAPQNSTGDSDSYTNQTSERSIKVMRFYFKDYHENTYEKKYGKDNNLRLFPTSFNKGTSEEYRAKYANKEREVVRDGYSVVHKGTWIIDTDYIYNDGLLEHMEVSRANPKNVELPIKMYCPNMTRGNITSMLYSWIPIIDQINVNWYNYQNMMARAIPDGWQFDLDALVSTPMGKGGKSLTAREQLEMFYQSGIIVTKNNSTPGNNKPPVIPMTNNNHQKAQTFLQNIFELVNVLRMLSGLNQASDASLPESGTLNGVASAALAGTEAALGYLYDGIKSIQHDMCIGIIRLRQNAALMNMNPASSITAFGKGANNFWNQNKDWTSYELGLKLLQKPTKDEWNDFYMLLKGAHDKGTIATSDYIYLMEVDNLKQARRLMAVREKRNIKVQQDQQMAQIQENNKGAADAALQAEKARQETLTLEYQLKTNHELSVKEADAAIQDSINQTKLLEAQVIADVKSKVSSLDSVTRIKSKQIEALARLAMHKEKDKQKA